MDRTHRNPNPEKDAFYQKTSLCFSSTPSKVLNVHLYSILLNSFIVLIVKNICHSQLLKRIIFLSAVTTEFSTVSKQTHIVSILGRRRRISLVLRLYFTVYPFSRHNTETAFKSESIIYNPVKAIVPSDGRLLGLFR